MQCTRCGAALPEGGEMCLSCGSQVVSDLSGGLSVGDVIGDKYVVGEELASGGMGRVYWAEQRPLGTPVCVKTLHTGATNDPQFAARFEREARTTSQLRHPNIVSVFDFGTLHDGTMYLVMEYVEGVSLATLSPKGRTMSAHRAVRILGQVCDALSFAHQRGVVHRDLKPANIMVVRMPDGDFVKVLDFGSALMLEAGEEAERLTRVGTVIGTPAYMAPEYILGRGVDARIDVYAVGVLLYSLLTGAPPFRGNAQSVFAQQVSVPPEPPRKRNPQSDCSVHMERVILKALLKNPAERFGTAAQLKSAMEKALEGDSSAVGDVEEQHAAGAVEVAHAERSVVLLSVQLPEQAATDEADRVRQLVEARGGVWHGRSNPDRASLAPGSDEVAPCFVFGLDRDVPEAAAEAMRCAVRLADLTGGRQMRAGVHDAQASCRGRFGDAGFDYQLFGDGMSLVHAMADHAQPGETVVSGPAARYVPSELTLTPIMPPEHVDAPVFALTDPVRSRGRVGRHLSFIGRDEEQRALLEVAVGASEGKVCVVQGGPGMGKSRLVQEIVPQAAQLDVLWAVVPATAREAVGPAHPASLLAALGWTSPGGGASTTERYAVDLMLGRYDRVEDDLTGERRQLRLVSAAIDGVVRRREQGSLVVVLDELHLADDLTWGLARRLIDMAPDLGVSVVLCVREEDELPFGVPSSARRLRLGSLSAKEVRNALAALEREDLDADTITRLSGVSRGVPLVLEELLPSRYRPDLDRLEGLDPEEVLAEIVASRIEAVDENAKRTLRTTAVLGLEPRDNEVRALLGVRAADPPGLAALEGAHLLHRNPAGRLFFPFSSARDIVLASTDARTLRELHACAADLLEGSPGAKIRMGEIGWHLYHAGHLERAYELLRSAAEAEQAEGSTPRATEHMRLALDAAERLGDDHAAEQASAARELGRLLMQAGRLDEAETMLRDAFPKAREKNVQWLAADLLRLHGRVLVLQGDVQDGEQEIEAALGYAEKRELVEVAAEASGDLAEGAESRGERDCAAELLRRGLSLIEAREDREAAAVRLQLYNRLGRLELQAGDFAGAIARFTQALGLAERLDDRYQCAGLFGNLGGAYARRGEMERAVHYTERALRASEAIGDQIGIARQSFNLALLRLSSGQQSTARQLLRGSHDAARRAGWREGLAMSAAAAAKLDR